MPWQITTRAVGEEDGTTSPLGEEEVGPISRSGGEAVLDDGTGAEAGQEPITLRYPEDGPVDGAATDVVNPFGAF